MKLEKHTIEQSTQYLKELTRRKQAVLMGRAAAGIRAALRAWDLHDQVILLPANTCYIVLWAVLKSGNRSLLVDVDRRTGNVTVEGLNAQIEAQPAVVIPCHMYGLPAPMQSICQWAEANHVKVIEDAALALGSTVDGRPAGSWGDASILSFGLGKIVDNQVGGALVTDDGALAEAVTSIMAETPVWDDHLMVLTNQWNGLYWPLHQYESQNPRLLELYPQLFALYSELTAYQLGGEDWVDLPAQLRDLSENLAHRTRLAKLYDSLLQVSTSSTLLPALERPRGHILWRYPLLVKPEIRDDLLAYLWEQGIHDATRWYPPLRPMATALAPHLQQSFTPVADALGSSIINLPLDEHVDENDVEYISGLVREFVDNL